MSPREFLTILYSVSGFVVAAAWVFRRPYTPDVAWIALAVCAYFAVLVFVGQRLVPVMAP